MPETSDSLLTTTTNSPSSLNPQKKDLTQPLPMWYTILMGKIFDKHAKSVFIETLRETGEPALAAKACGFALSTCQTHARKDEEFAQAGFEALQAYRATIAAEIHRRAIEGVDEPVFQQGNLVGHKRKYSDALLLAHAKRHMPNEYGDKKTITHEHTASLNAQDLTPESRELLRKLLELETPKDEMP